MKKVKDQLFEYVKNKDTLFYWYHNPQRINDINGNEKSPVKVIIDDKKNKTGVIHKSLYEFFDATLDEVRLKEANKFSTFALNISDNSILAYFRVAASKREFASDIDYNMQRDHAVHTLYNYILGWYFFDYSDKVQDEFTKNLVHKNNCLNLSSFILSLHPNERAIYVKDGGFNRYGNIEKLLDEEKIVLANEFGDVWSITSLLHDIGYILEGTISSVSTEVENIRISRGARIIHDFFNHRFWNTTQIDFRAARSIAKVLGVSFPEFKNSKSLASLGDHLCDIGVCENIRKYLCKISGFSSHDFIFQDYGLNREAFSLWIKHYQVYVNTNNDFYKENKKSRMERILEIVKKEYSDAMWNGSIQGHRNLNHGVCSGLIVLQALSFFYDFMFGFERIDSWDQYQSEYKELNNKGCLNEMNVISEQSYWDINAWITNKFLPKQISQRGKRNADFWFNKVLWATASVAIHDIIQAKYYEKICKKHGNKESIKIGLDDDPLAFLGVLVDALQEWDRYTVSGESAFSDKEILLQSTDVDMGIGEEENNKLLHFYYPPKGVNMKDFSNDIKNVLECCLLGWKEIVEIGMNISCPYCDNKEYNSELEGISLKCGYIKNGKTTGRCNMIQ